MTSLPSDALAAHDRAVIQGCLNATVNGPFFPDQEFQTLFGLTRSEVEYVLDSWPDLPEVAVAGYDSPAHYQAVAIGNSMNNLLGYPHRVHGDAFVSEVGTSEADVAETFARWRGDAFESGAEGQFDRLR